MLRLGIVGLPNVGKSTLFNALTSANVLAANYPFATKDPNVGRVNVPDGRLDELARIVEPQRIVPAAASGTDNAIFRIGKEAAARFRLRAIDPAECAELLRLEAAAMEEFGALCPVPTPRPIGIGRPGPLYPMPWSVQSWIEGEVATPVGLSGSGTFARDLGSRIAQRHNIAR